MDISTIGYLPIIFWNFLTEARGAPNSRKVDIIHTVSIKKKEFCQWTGSRVVEARRWRNDGMPIASTSSGAGLPIFGYRTYLYPMDSYFALILVLPLRPDPLLANRQKLGEFVLTGRSVRIRLPGVVYT